MWQLTCFWVKGRRETFPPLFALALAKTESSPTFSAAGFIVTNASRAGPLSQTKPVAIVAAVPIKSRSQQNSIVAQIALSPFISKIKSITIFYIVQLRTRTFNFLLSIDPLEGLNANLQVMERSWHCFRQ